MMNTAFKTTLALGAAGLSLMMLAGGAGAQTQTGDPNLAPVFSTYNGKAAPNFTSSAQGVGFDANGGFGKLSNSTTVATAQSVYETFKFDSSAAGTFNTLAAGTTAQLQVFGVNNNVNAGAPFDVYAVLYAYNSNSAAGLMPVTGPDLFGALALLLGLLHAHQGGPAQRGRLELRSLRHRVRLRRPHSRVRRRRHRAARLLQFCTCLGTPVSPSPL